MNKIINFNYVINNVKLKQFNEIIYQNKKMPKTYIKRKYGVNKYNGIYSINNGLLSVSINDEYLIILNKLILERKLRVNLPNKNENKKVNKI